MSKTEMNRRTFLRVSTLAGSSLLVGCSFSSPKIVSTKVGSEKDLGLWVRIGKDNSITLILPSAEMGQHAHTGQAMLVAEELEANWESINVVTAPINPEYVNPELFNKQRTDGSTSISAFWDKLRYVGASTRMMLTQAAANEWGVSVEECKARCDDDRNCFSIDYKVTPILDLGDQDPVNCCLGGCRMGDQGCNNDNADNAHGGDSNGNGIFVVGVVLLPCRYVYCYFRH